MPDRLLPSHKSSTDEAWPIVLVYAGFASLWILVSDKALDWLITDTASMTRISMLKGWLFVAVTSLFLFSLIRRMVNRLHHSIDAVRQRELELRESKSRLQATLDALPDMLFEVSQDGRIYRCHTHRDDLLASPPDQFLGKLFSEFLPPQATQVCLAALREAAEHGYSTGKTYALQLPQGQRWFELSVSPLRNSEDPHDHFIFIARDITQRKSADEKLQLAGRVFTHAREGIMVTSADGVIVDVNEAFTRITGYARDEAVGQKPSLLQSGRQGPAFYAGLWGDLMARGYWSGEIWNRRKNGEIFAELMTISAIRDALGHTVQYVALLSDITELKEHQIELERVAHFDALTNLPNRILLTDRLQQAMQHMPHSGQQLAVAFLDLDDFKSVNDTYGHDIGDLLLLALAKRIKETLREGDTLARIGGDEFVAVLIDLDNVAASLPLLTRLVSAACEPVQLGDLTVQVSASLGVTFYPQAQTLDADQLLRQADQAMYQAKLAGKNRYHLFDAEQDSSIRDRHETLTGIGQALARNEFVLHYQPKVNMRTGRVVGVEALIRWQHPVKGLLAPGLFLPVVEDHPLSVAMGEWVLDTALGQIETWRRAGLDLAISVNVGARQLQQSDFVMRLKTILAAHPQVDPAWLELEILETSALHDMTQVSRVIEACEQMGVKFALDDFGTGYSSLTYLKRLRVALLKIDQSFVHDMLDNADDLAILQGVIGLAAAFKREVIAEGVETVAHGTALLQLGCDLAQGYGIARPMPADALPGWVSTWRPDPARQAPAA